MITLHIIGGVIKPLVISHLWLCWLTRGWSTSTLLIARIVERIMHVYFLGFLVLVLVAELRLRGRDFFKRWLVIVILTIIVYVHIRLSFWNLNWVRRVLILLAWTRRFVGKWIIMNLLWLLVCKRIIMDWRFEMCFDWWSTGGTSSIGT